MLDAVASTNHAPPSFPRRPYPPKRTGRWLPGTGWGRGWLLPSCCGSCRCCLTRWIEWLTWRLQIMGFLYLHAPTAYFPQLSAIILTGGFPFHWLNKSSHRKVQSGTFAFGIKAFCMGWEEIENCNGFQWFLSTQICIHRWVYVSYVIFRSFPTFCLPAFMQWVVIFLHFIIIQTGRFWNSPSPHNGKKWARIVTFGGCTVVLYLTSTGKYVFLFEISSGSSTNCILG